MGMKLVRRPRSAKRVVPLVRHEVSVAYNALAETVISLLLDEVADYDHKPEITYKVTVGTKKWTFELKAKIIFKGGPGSGHHGHQGRPGKRGGSTSSGGGGGSGSGGASGSGYSQEYAGILETAAQQRGRPVPDDVAQRLSSRHDDISKLVGGASALEDLVSGDWEYWESAGKYDLTPNERKRVVRYVETLWEA